MKIDGQAVRVAPGTHILEAACKLGIHIPTLCRHPDLPPLSACRVCLVKRLPDGAFVPACATEAEDGLAVESETPEVHAMRRTALELLLDEHRGDCEAPCRMACPAFLNIPDTLRAAAAGDWPEALALARRALVFPGILGCICSAPCEGVCRRRDVDETLSIRLVHRFVGEWALASGAELPPCSPATGKTVAVVGGGVSGLAAAWHLLLAGHRAVVYERAPAVGGAVRTQIDASRLPRLVLEGEFGVVRRLGAQIRHTEVGAQTSLDEIRAGADAVLVACGRVDEAGAAALGLPFRGRGLVTDAAGQTPLEGVFAAGACVRPARLAVQAVAAARSAALAIGGYLSGAAPAGFQRPFNCRAGALSEEEIRELSRGVSPAAPARSGEGDGPLAADEAAGEALRCLHCDCLKAANCKLRRYAREYGARPGRHRIPRHPFRRETTHPAIVFEPGKCIECGLCVQLCEQQRDELGLTFIGRGFDVRVQPPLGESVADALGGLADSLARACPTGALAHRRGEAAAL